MPPWLQSTAGLLVAVALAPTPAGATLKAPTSDPLPRGFVRFHDPAQWPLIAKRALGVVSSVTAVRICRARVPAVLIETRPPGRTHRVIIAHIGASAYSIGYSFASSRPSADVLVFVASFCGYTSTKS